MTDRKDWSPERIAAEARMASTLSALEWCQRESWAAEVREREAYTQVDKARNALYTLVAFEDLTRPIEAP